MIILLAMLAIAWGLDWSNFSSGVRYARTGPENGGVFIGFAGYLVTMPYAVDWLDALYTAKLKKLNVSHVFAVQGPDQVRAALADSLLFITRLRSSTGIERSTRRRWQSAFLSSFQARLSL